MAEKLSHYPENQAQKERKNSLSFPSIEIYPSPTIVQRTIHSLEGTPAKINVTSSPNHGIERTFDLTEELLDHGFQVIPHIGAYEIKDENHLNTTVKYLADCAISEIFLVKGDGEQKGKYKTSAQLLKDIGKSGLHLERVGIAGYPEGLSHMTNEQLLKGLQTRKELTERMNAQLYIVTQICFDAEKLVEYAEMVNRILDIPVIVGLPIPEETKKLHAIAERLDVGYSKDILLKKDAFDPIDLIDELTNSYDSNLFAGFHLYTLNKVGRTASWLIANFN